MPSDTTQSDQTHSSQIEPKYKTDLSTLPRDAIIRLPDVLRLFPVSKSTWWAGIKAGRYPSPIRLGNRAVGWRLGSILDLSRNMQEVA
ncbi:MAG: AlpA family phage regulatory protein [Candidatus Sedimenticola sp. (ex Thyasira tokunagai)]